MTATTPSRPSVFPILSVNFVGTLGFSIVLPFLVYLVTRLGGNALVYGVMGATYSAFQLVGAPILGGWSDRYGRKRILLLSHLGTLASWVVFLAALFLPVTVLAAVDSPVLGTFTVTLPLVVLFLARALDGLTGGNVSVANAYLADVSDEGHRSANFGKLAVSSNLGFIAGPALAGALGATAWGETLPVVAAIAVSIVAALLIVFRLPDVSPCILTTNPERVSVSTVLDQGHKPCYEITARQDLGIRGVLALPGMAALLGVYFLVYLAFNFFYIAFPVYAATTLLWTLPQTGVFFSAMGIMMALVQGPILSRASRRWTDRTLVLWGSGFLAVSFLFFVASALPLLYAGTALLAVGNGVMWPSLLSVISKATSPANQGAVQGVAGSAAAVASIAGLLIGGLLFAAIGSRIFVLSAMMTGVVFLVGVRAVRLAPAGAATRPAP